MTKGVLLLSASLVLLLGCNPNPSKEERIQTLEAELQSSLRRITELEEMTAVKENEINNKTENEMKLGAFSVSLSVKDIHVAKAFYQKLGFTEMGGALEQNYLIMKNENSVIGLFQGMFEGNILTFNPGWDESGKDIDSFDDIRQIQQELKMKDINVGTEIEKESSGPASFTITDPDGNMILIDQHR